ncbi:MAG: hypothetical protein ACE5KE_16090 [Methanosarcinales archaeon]
MKSEIVTKTKTKTPETPDLIDEKFVQLVTKTRDMLNELLETIEAMKAEKEREGMPTEQEMLEAINKSVITKRVWGALNDSILRYPYPGEEDEKEDTTYC